MIYENMYIYVVRVSKFKILNQTLITILIKPRTVSENRIEIHEISKFYCINVLEDRNVYTENIPLNI